VTRTGISWKPGCKATRIAPVRQYVDVEVYPQTIPPEDLPDGYIH
jgi:hypothetical protein